MFTLQFIVVWFVLPHRLHFGLPSNERLPFSVDLTNKSSTFLVKASNKSVILFCSGVGTWGMTGSFDCTGWSKQIASGIEFPS